MDALPANRWWSGPCWIPSGIPAWSHHAPSGPCLRAATATRDLKWAKLWTSAVCFPAPSKWSPHQGRDSEVPGVHLLCQPVHLSPCVQEDHGLGDCQSLVQITEGVQLPLLQWRKMGILVSVASPTTFELSFWPEIFKTAVNRKQLKCNAARVLTPSNRKLSNTCYSMALTD